MRRFISMGQKVKEYSSPSELDILPMFLPITQARGGGQVRGVRPRGKTLREVAERSDSLGDFGRHRCDWLHELRRVSTRRQAEAVIAEEPLRLGEKFPLRHIADAWQAAYAEHVAGFTSFRGGHGGIARADAGRCAHDCDFTNQRLRTRTKRRTRFLCALVIRRHSLTCAITSSPRSMPLTTRALVASCHRSSLHGGRIKWLTESTILNATWALRPAQGTRRRMKRPAMSKADGRVEWLPGLGSNQ